jgi:hypothetical protein
MTDGVKILKESLTILAADAQTQMSYLENLGVPECADELALEYDDTAAAADTMLDRGELNREQRDSIVQLNNFLEGISGESNAHLWTTAALQTSLEWQEVRRMAMASLALLEP